MPLTRDQVVEYIKNADTRALRALMEAIGDATGVAQPAGFEPRPRAPWLYHFSENEQIEFDVILTGFDPERKIETMKAVRQVTGVGLAEGKRLVESVPTTLKRHLRKDEAYDMRDALIAVGAFVEVR